MEPRERAIRRNELRRIEANIKARSDANWRILRRARKGSYEERAAMAVRSELLSIRSMIDTRLVEVKEPELFDFSVVKEGVRGEEDTEEED